MTNDPNPSIRSERAATTHDGWTLPVEVTEGPDPAIVLLHGFPGGIDTWAGVIGPLHALGGRRIVVPEQRGYAAGARPERSNDYRIEPLVDDVVAVIEQHAGGRAHLVGHDWGGVVAWHLAGLRPELVESLVVLSTPHPRAFAASLTSSMQAVRSSYAALLLVPRLPEKVLLARRATVLRTWLRAGGLDGVRAQRYADAMREPGRLRAALHWYRAAARHAAATAHAGPVQVPTTFVWGTRDPALGARAAHLTAVQVRGPYRFRPLARSGHWLPERDAATVVSELEQHLAWVESLQPSGDRD